MKKRKIRKDRLFILIFCCILFVFLQIKFLPILFNSVCNLFNNIVENKELIDFKEIKEFDFEINSKEYLLIDLNTNKALYGKDYDEQIYPASLTKLFTLDTLLNYENDLNNKASFTKEQFDVLIEADASLAGLKADKEYSLADIGFALTLPSGGDAAKAIENYFNRKGLNLVDEMNKRCEILELTNSHFTNSIGLHDDDLYTSLSDISVIVYDILKLHPEYLKSLSYTLDDGIIVNSTLSYLCNNEIANILGGKTGYTPVSGCSVVVIYSINDNEYLLILANAEGSPYEDFKPHFEDVKLILEKLYNN